MGSSEEVEVSKETFEPKVKSCVQIVHDSYRSDGEIRDSDSDHEDDHNDYHKDNKVSSKRNNYKTTSNRDEYNYYSDDDRFNKRDRYNDHSDEERSSKRDKYKDYGDDERSNRRDRYKDYNDDERSNKRDKYKDYSDSERSNKRDRYKDYSDSERSNKRDKYKDYSDDERSNKRDRYKDYSDEERSNKRDKYKDYSDNERSNKRDRHSDYSDNDKRYPKKSRVGSDNDDNDYNNRTRKHHSASSNYDKEEYQKSSNKRRDNRSHRKDCGSYVNKVDKHGHGDEILHRDDVKPTGTGGDQDQTQQVKKINDEKENNNDIHQNKDPQPQTKRKLTVGAYIPPSKLREMQAGITDKNSTEYQRMSWEALKKSINGLVNKVNIANIEFIVGELIRENIVRGRGVLAQTIIRAQVASPTFTSVYAAFVSIINTKFPKLGELILRRLIIQFRKAYKRNDKRVCINSVTFIAHLVNQQVAHELLALQILTLMLHNHTGDSVEVAVSFLKDIGQKLLEVSPKGVNAVFERLRHILHDSQTDKRVQYMIEVIFHSRRDNFKNSDIIPEDLDLVEEDDQITHLLQLDDDGNGEDILNVFKFDPDYVQNEEKYNQIKKNILGEDDDDDDSSGDEEDDDDDDGDDDEEDEENKEKTEIIDMTGTNVIALRRTLFLTIQSSLDFQECAHKMMKIHLKEGQQYEFCLMVVEACAQDRSYQKFFGLLAHRFCLLRREFLEQYIIIFQEQYENCHHLDTNKLRNTAKLFGHLLWSDGVPWTVLQCIKLNEEETTSSSRIFIKIIFQEMSEFLGIKKLLERLKDPSIEMYLEGIFPHDDPKHTRFAINFFTAIGLGVLTDDLREHLRTMPKVSTAAQKMAAAAGLDDSSSSSSSSSSDSSDSSSSSSSDSSDSEDDNRKKEGKAKKSSDSEDDNRKKEGKAKKSSDSEDDNRKKERKAKKRTSEKNTNDKKEASR